MNTNYATELIIDSEFHNVIPPLIKDEYMGLEQSLISEGCRDSLVTWIDTLTKNEILLDGHNRYEICKRLNIPFKTVTIELPNRNAVEKWIILNQFGRRNLTTFQRAELALKLEPLIKSSIKVMAKEKQVIGGKEKVPQNSTEPIETRREVDRITKVSHDTTAKVKVILENVDEATKIKLRAGDTSINAEYKKIQQNIHEAKREDRRKENASVIANVSSPIQLIQSNAKFATILLDPPWDWGDEGDINQLGRAKPDYATIPFEELKLLPVMELADIDAHIYMWITNRSLPKGFILLEVWGFRYITTLTWGKPTFGMGNYFRGQTEHILFGVRGSQPLKRKDASTLLPQWNRGSGGHSSKPIEIYEFIESCSPGPWLEMFGRIQQDGWTIWGEKTK